MNSGSRGRTATIHGTVGPSADTPADIAARVMVRRLLEQHPELVGEVSRSGIAVVIEVPGSAWVDPVAEAWRELALQTDDVPDDADDLDPGAACDPADRWVELRRDGSLKSHNLREGNGTIALALAAGRAVYGFSPAPEQYLPADLLRVADMRVCVQRPNSQAITEIVTALTGAAPTGKLEDHLARLVEIDDLWLAYRRGEGADRCLTRLAKLVVARHKPPSITLTDLHGMDEAKTWGLALARDLADYRQGSLPWSAVDRGVLVYGQPGTGKTTFAKALAGSCCVPLVAASLGQWQATGHLGDLLKAMADTFKAARAAAPAILFIDEIDSFGDRGSFKNDSKDYSIQVVNGLLEHLDGIGNRDGVVVVGACNRPDRLDPAIVRSGRLDRMIPIPLPDQHALAKIMRHHLTADLAGENLAAAAKLAQGASGADCERWVRGARRRARSESRAMVLDDLIAEVRGTSAATPHDWLRRFAVHEAGHVLAILHDRPEDLTMVTVRQTARSGGGILTSNDDRRPITPPELECNLILLLAGRAAEEVILGSVSAGAGGSETSDLARATALATAASTAWGLTGDGLLWQGMPEPTTVGSMLALRPDLAQGVKTKLADAYSAAKGLVTRHRDLVEKIADHLVEHETLDGNDVRALAGMTIPKAVA